MKRIYQICFFYFSLCFVFSCANNKDNYELKRQREYNAFAYGIFTGTEPIVWNSKESNEMIHRTKYKKPFFALAPHFAGQVYPITCGPATARIVLSAIYARTNTPFPLDKENSIYKDRSGADIGIFKMSERNVFGVYNGDDEELDYDIIIRKKKHTYGEYKGKYDGGIWPNKLAEIINMHKPAKATYFEVKPTSADKGSVDNFRKLVKQIMLSDNKYLICHFHIAAVIPYTSGHFSPIVAYDEITDRVLIMDVASHNATWSWIKVEELYRAMNTALRGSKSGYIVVEEVIEKDKTNNDNKIKK